MKIKYFFISLFLSMIFCSCNASIDPLKLYGKWSYVKVENLNNNPPDSVSASELAVQQPSITFTQNKGLVIMWGGKKLSSGKFRIEKNMIRYTEDLPEGKKREFPFLVSELTEDHLIFETMEQSSTRVTAVKAR